MQVQGVTAPRGADHRDGIHQWGSGVGEVRELAARDLLFQHRRACRRPEIRHDASELSGGISDIRGVGVAGSRSDYAHEGSDLVLGLAVLGQRLTAKV